MLLGKIIGKRSKNDTVEYVGVLVSVADACKGIRDGELKLVTESAHGIQKDVIVKNTGRGDDSDYLTTGGDPSETNNVDEQPEI